jgi:hypothetical protein
MFYDYEVHHKKSPRYFNTSAILLHRKQKYQKAFRFTMGCLMSSPAAVKEPIPEEPIPEKSIPEKSIPKKPSGPKPEKPKPMIFALMRNAHEVIRAAQRDLKEAIENDDLKGAKTIHENLTRFTMMHMWMEEGSGTDKSPIGMFK